MEIYDCTNESESTMAGVLRQACELTNHDSRSMR